jgi:hypothetical protein
LEQILTKDTKIVALCHVSNLLGEIIDLPYDSQARAFEGGTGLPDRRRRRGVRAAPADQSERVGRGLVRSS